MNKFVFVVCGGKEHIEELNFSLKFLRHFSKNEIIVITDKNRNEIKIEHDNIIDSETPANFNNHQASIYLKTSIHKHLSPDNNYCYLDGDIVAINNNVDRIFEHYTSPVTFSRDHCKINEFSPFAINCNCIEENISRENYFNESLNKVFGKISFNSPKQKSDSAQLLSYFKDLQKKPIKNIFKSIRYFLLRYVLPAKQFKLKSYIFNKKNKCWYNSDGNIVLFDYPYYSKKLWDIAGIKYNSSKDIWICKDGTTFNFDVPSCNHLTEYLNKEYGVNIQPDWQHWNGGVFLFDDSSADFLNYWHEQTIKEFSNPYTKTRDQGTLALTVWKFGLQNQPNIPTEFNWITEYANYDIAWKKDFGYTRDGFKTNFSPNLLHIYHEWGKTGWSIWDSVVKLGEENGLI